MAKKRKQNIEMDIGLTDHDCEVLQIVLERGLDLLEAVGTDPDVMNKFPGFSTSFLYHVYTGTDFSATEFALVAYCLDLAVDAISGSIEVADDIRSTLSAHMFVIRKLSDRFSKGRDKLLQ